ncbi:MAG: helix-turn-helix transcriptional regulator, partial [Amaricoccus sp.]
YWRARLRHAVHEALLQRFSELAADNQTSKKSLASRLDVDPAQVTRWMNFPSNITLDTVSDLFLAMNCTVDLLSCRMDKAPNHHYATDTSAMIVTSGRPDDQLISGLTGPVNTTHARKKILAFRNAHR